MRTALSIIGAIGLVGLVASCQTGAASLAAASNPSAYRVAVDYTSLKVMTAQPVPVEPIFMALCDDSGSPPDRAIKIAGPHAHTSVMIHMNDAAAAAFEKPGSAYPVGSVIVKEKRHGQGASKIWGVGGMIKRAPGYDPQNGDWEYLYVDGPGKLNSGRIASCIECHSRARASDHVFGDWANPSKPR